MGLAVSPATTSIMMAVPVNKAGIGSAMNDTTRQLGGALGVAVLGTIMSSVYLNGIQPLRQNIPVPPALAAQAEQAFDAISAGIQAAHVVANRLAANPLAPPDAAKLIIETADQAFVSGMNTAMLIGSIIMLGAALFALAFLPTQVRRMETDAPARVEVIPSPAGD
jgi:hypothetical protein